MLTNPKASPHGGEARLPGVEVLVTPFSTNTTSLLEPVSVVLMWACHRYLQT